MPELPSQLPWRRFVRVLHKLGYTEVKGKAGPGRVFFNPARKPNSVSFHEPHPGEDMRKRMLVVYLRKLLLDPGEFMRLLEHS